MYRIRAFEFIQRLSLEKDHNLPPKTILEMLLGPQVHLNEFMKQINDCGRADCDKSLVTSCQYLHGIAPTPIWKHRTQDRVVMIHTKATRQLQYAAALLA